MSSGGLIYAAIVILWAAVLIPMWLRNHDTAAENRSAERFGQAMRVLSRKEQEDADVARETPVDQAARHETAEPSAPARPAQRAAQRPVQRSVRRQASRPARRPAQRHGRRTLAQRRARTLGVMVGLMVLITLVAVVSPVPWWAPLPVVALLGGFVVHLRIQALQRQRRPGSAHRPAERGAAAEPAVDAPLERPTSGFVSGPSKAVVVETKGVGNSSELTFEQDGDVDRDGDETWRPNPLPLPTYVTAPKAVRPIKVIDLTTPGAWSSGRILDDDLADEDLLAAEVADEELDALLAQEAAPPRPAAKENHENGDAERRAVGD